MLAINRHSRQRRFVDPGTGFARKNADFKAAD